MGSTHHRTGFLSSPHGFPILPVAVNLVLWALRDACAPSRQDPSRGLEAGCPNPGFIRRWEGSCFQLASSGLASLVRLTCAELAPRAAVQQRQASSTIILFPVTAKELPLPTSAGRSYLKFTPEETRVLMANFPQRRTKRPLPLADSCGVCVYLSGPRWPRCCLWVEGGRPRASCQRQTQQPPVPSRSAKHQLPTPVPPPPVSP